MQCLDTGTLDTPFNKDTETNVFQIYYACSISRIFNLEG